MSLFNPKMADFENDPLPAIQLAIAILLDKPIVLAVLPGREDSIPVKLLAIADHVIVGGVEELADGVQRWLEGSAMTTPNTPGSLAGHKHEWVSDPFRRPFATKACKICGVELEAYVATLEAEKRALEADVIDRENAVAFDAQPEGKPHCIGCGKTEDELHDKDCPHIYGTMQSEGRA